MHDLITILSIMAPEDLNNRNPRRTACITPYENIRCNCSRGQEANSLAQRVRRQFNLCPLCAKCVMHLIQKVLSISVVV